MKKVLGSPEFKLLSVVSVIAIALALLAHAKPSASNKSMKEAVEPAAATYEVSLNDSSK